MTFYVPVAEVIWNLSRSRMLILHLEELRPGGVKCPQCFEQVRLSSLANDVRKGRHEFITAQAKSNRKRHNISAFDEVQLELIASKAELYHCKQEVGVIGGEEAEPEEIASATEFKLGLNIKEERISVGIDIDKAEIDLPHKVFLGALMHEIDKQISHVPDWIRQEYKHRKTAENCQCQQLR